MNVLTLDHIDKAYGVRKLFDGTSFYLQEGDKVGIIGRNGCGKSTLLRMIAGLESLDNGKRVLANHVVLRYLPQDPEFLEDQTVLSYMLESDGQTEIWDLEAKAKTMLNELDLPMFDVGVSTLSGGQKKRLALARLLLWPVDIYVLDEPTNHLDSGMSAWLEDFLIGTKACIVMVTHDRYFLERVTNSIVELSFGKLYRYDTNYSGYLEASFQRLQSERASERKRQSILRNEILWVMRGARARTTKQKARLERFEELSKMEGPKVSGNVEMSSIASRMGRTTIELLDVVKAYGDHVLINDFSYIFLKTDRVGFVGKNGSGKSTLMKMIAGIISPTFGQITIGQTIKIGYYSQELPKTKEECIDKKQWMDPSLRVIDYIRNTAEYIKTQDGEYSASVMLERFLFSGEEQYGKLEKLSGGEKRRLQLLRVLMEAPNVLILDEPTNDLDVETLTVLEDYLDCFDGIVIIVSHDRYFLDRNVKRIFAFGEGGEIKQYEGGYTDYLEKIKDSSPLKPKVENKTQKPEKSNTRYREKKLKFTYAEQKEYDSIEGEIAKIEERLLEIDGQMQTNATDFVKLAELTKEKEDLEKKLEEKMDRWMYLEDLAARIENQ